MTKHDLSSRHFQRKISKFCELRIAPIAFRRVSENIRPYLASLIIYRKSPPLLNGHIDWTMISQACGIEAELTAELKKQLRPGLDAIIRWLGVPPAAEERRAPKSTVSSSKMAPTRKAASASSTRKPQCAATDGAFTRSASTQRGPAPKAISPFPEALFEATEDPVSFQDTLVYHMRRFGDTYWQLYRAVVHLDETFDNKTLLSWMQGERVPRSVASFNILRRIERRYRLSEGYFKEKLPHQARSLYGDDLGDISPAERRRISLHLPEDFNSLPFTKREEILDWVRRVIISGSTEYRRYQAAASKQRYAIRFPDVTYGGSSISPRSLASAVSTYQNAVGWEVLIPSVAFKNSGSSFFGQKPFRLILPDLLDLYKYLDAYIDRHRGVLLGGAKDPQTLFVKTVKTTSIDAAYNSTTFYEAWRTVIQRYGIYNPYTGRGAIKGLLPHGPHNLRDILATHILKQTGSYEQASYAIQDTPDVVQQHYGRFLPQDKAALAAKILNQVWEAA